MRLLSFLALIGCGGASDGTSDTAATPATGPATGAATSSGTTSTGPLSHELDVLPIWVEKCGTSCHIEDDDGGLTLSYDTIVSFPSEDVPTMFRVAPGSLDDSYLWHKIEGTHLTVGGAGSQMPRGFLELKPKERNLIQRWIEEGALP